MSQSLFTTIWRRAFYTTARAQQPRLRISPDNPLDSLPNLNTLHPLLDHPPTRSSATNDDESSKDAYGETLAFPRPPKHLLPTDSHDAPRSELDVDLKNLHKRTLSIRRTVNMTRKGKVVSMSALVVVGNGNGLVGYGEGKSDELGSAVRKATDRAIKHLEVIPRYDNRTVLHDIQHEYKSTKIYLRARPPGFGNRSNRLIHEVCKCVGITDISGKVLGSRTPINVVKGTFEALRRQRDAQEFARGRGKRLVDVQHVYYGVE